MDLLLIQIFFKEQTRNATNTKKCRKSMNAIKNVFFVCVEVAGSSPTLEGVGSNRKEARFFLTGFRSHVSLGKQKH